MSFPSRDGLGFPLEDTGTQTARTSGALTVLALPTRPGKWSAARCSAVASSEAFPYPKAMEVKLTPDQKAFVRDAIESGRLQREEDAVQEALALWEERERTRAEFLAAVDEADASLARGEGRIITQQSMLKLAAEVKQRGRARLAAEQAPDR